MDEPVTRDRLAGGAVSLLQPGRGHRAGHDAVLLAGWADIRPGDKVADLGSASGAIGLLLARRVPDADLTFVERDPALVALCADNIATNGLSGHARAVAADLFASHAARAALGLAGQDHDLAVTNPPFFDEAERASPHAGRRAAHALAGGTLRDWLRAAADTLAGRGRLAMIHRADRLAECLAALAPWFGSIVVRPVHTRPDAPATRILLAAVKGGRAPLRLDPPLALARGGSAGSAQ